MFILYSHLSKHDIHQAYLYMYLKLMEPKVLNEEVTVSIYKSPHHTTQQF